MNASAIGQVLVSWLCLTTGAGFLIVAFDGNETGSVMRIRFAALSASLALLIVPVQLSAKGDTVRITIKGGDLAAPIEITDRAVAAYFRVWSGPGTKSQRAAGG
jgi:hypothetical protein